MPYSSIGDVPKSLKTAGLTLGQANDWARYYDEAKRFGVGSAAAVAWTRFKKKYYKSGNTWKIKKTYKGEKKMSEKFKGWELLYRFSPQTLPLESVAEAEGKVYEKELIREGEWAHPQRSNVKLKITLARMKKWVENFSKDLFKVPVPKRHSLDPEDNRGWVKKLFIKEDENGKHVLFGHLDITNDKMQNLIDNGDIQDVSVSVAPYQDNKGKKHGEMIQHVALTVIPHIDKQMGFTPVNAEGYMSLEEIGYIDSIKEKLGGFEQLEEQKYPEGSQESVKEDLHNAISEARIFPEQENFNIVGTYPDRIIVMYFGGGTGETGTPRMDRYFEIPYTKDLNRRYVFGDKKELIKKYYFMPKEYNKTLFEKLNKEEEKEFKLLEQFIVAGEIPFDLIAQREDISPAAKKAAISKYGNVKYADEKNKKYPLDSPDHVRAASRYIGMPRNRKKYSATDLRIIESNIDKAMKKFKIGKYAAEAKSEKIVTCECLECGKTIKSKEHCRDIKCPECGSEMRRKERPGIGTEKENDKGEVKEMEELEKLQEQNDQLEAEKVELSKKVETVEAENGELKTKIADLEKVSQEQKKKLDEIEAERKAAFEVAVEEKVSKYVEDGHILPKEKEDVKAVLLEGGKAAEVLEKTIKDRKAVDLEDKTTSSSPDPNKTDEMTPDKAKAEASRIMGENKKKDKE